MNNVFIYILTTYPAPNILHVSIHAIQCVALLCLCTHLQILCLELPRDLSSNNTNVPVLKWTSKIFPHHDKQRTISYLHIEISKILKVSWYLHKKGIETNKSIVTVTFLVIFYSIKQQQLFWRIHFCFSANEWTVWTWTIFHQSSDHKCYKLPTNYLSIFILFFVGVKVKNVQWTQVFCYTWLLKLKWAKVSCQSTNWNFCNF